MQKKDKRIYDAEDTRKVDSTESKALKAVTHTCRDDPCGRPLTRG